MYDDQLTLAPAARRGGTAGQPGQGQIHHRSGRLTAGTGADQRYQSGKVLAMTTAMQPAC